MKTAQKCQPNKEMNTNHSRNDRWICADNQDIWVRVWLPFGSSFLESTIDHLVTQELSSTVSSIPSKPGQTNRSVSELDKQYCALRASSEPDWCVTRLLRNAITLSRASPSEAAPRLCVAQAPSSQSPNTRRSAQRILQLTGCCELAGFSFTRLHNRLLLEPAWMSVIT